MHLLILRSYFKVCGQIKQLTLCLLGVLFCSSTVGQALAFPLTRDVKNHLDSRLALCNHSAGQFRIVAKLHPNLSCGFSSENEKLNASDKTYHKGQGQHYYNDVGFKSLNYVIVMHVEHTFNLSN